MKYILHFLVALTLLSPVAAFAQTDPPTPPPTEEVTGGSLTFVPLSGLPGLPDAVDDNTLTDFLNNLYKICIGVAAALAVFQIMHGGIKFMTNKGSISENEQARSLIQGAVLGLILVLSPVIVFGIINPRILELNFATSELASEFSGEIQPGGDTESPIDPAAPYVENAFLSFRGVDSPEAAREYGDNFCQPSNIPESLRHLIERYDYGDDDEPVNGSAWGFVECAALSTNYAKFRVGGQVWRPIPDNDNDKRYREFRSGCSRDGGRVVESIDRFGLDWEDLLPFMGDLTTRDCQGGEITAITNAYGEPEGHLECVQAHMVCRRP